MIQSDFYRYFFAFRPNLVQRLLARVDRDRLAMILASSTRSSGPSHGSPTNCC